MAEAFTSYSVDNDRIFRSALQKASEQVGDLRIPFTLIAADFYKSQKAIWGLKGPGQYPDLAPKTKRSKLLAGIPVYPILKRSGALESAASEQGGPGNITIIEKNSLSLGVSESTVPYAVYHQSDRPRTKLPLRKFLFIGPEAPRFAMNEQIGRVQRWTGIMSGYVSQKLAQLGNVKESA